MATIPDIRPTLKGTVKFFAPLKAFGYIIPEHGGRDVYFHISVCRILRCIEIPAGAAVRYELTEPVTDRRASIVEMDQPTEVCPCCGRQG